MTSYMVHFLVGGAMMALATSPALAEGTEQPAEPLSDQQELERRFAASDANGDGKLTPEEAKAGGMKRVAKYFGRIDGDDDGFVTLDELNKITGARGE